MVSKSMFAPTVPSHIFVYYYYQVFVSKERVLVYYTPLWHTFMLGSSLHLCYSRQVFSGLIVFSYRIVNLLLLIVFWSSAAKHNKRLRFRLPCRFFNLMMVIWSHRHLIDRHCLVLSHVRLGWSEFYDLSTCSKLS